MVCVSILYLLENTSCFLAKSGLVKLFATIQSWDTWNKLLCWFLKGVCYKTKIECMEIHVVCVGKGSRNAFRWEHKDKYRNTLLWENSVGYEEVNITAIDSVFHAFSFFFSLFLFFFFLPVFIVALSFVSFFFHFFRSLKFGYFTAVIFFIVFIFCSIHFNLRISIFLRACFTVSKINFCFSRSMVKPLTSDLQTRSEYIWVTYGWATSIYGRQKSAHKCHTNDIRNITLCEAFGVFWL